MKKVILLILAFNYHALFSQSKINYENLAKASESWGLIKYFHPDRPGPAFDSAFAANVPAMLEATDEKQWREILGTWLRVLKDPATQLVPPEDGQSSQENLDSYFTPDGTLVVKITGFKVFDDYFKMMDFTRTIGEQLTHATNGVIFDLRQPSRLPPEYEGYLNFYFESISNTLAAEVVPQYKSIYYSGFKPERGNSSGGYTISEVIRNSIQAGNFHHLKQKAVWIVNDYSELPDAALSQQASGAGLIIGRSSNISNLAPISTTFKLSNSLLIKFKTAELVMPNGITPTADILYSESENPIDIAKKLIHENRQRNSESPKAIKGASIATTNRAYPSNKFPSVGYRVLAAAKMFYVIETFFPYYNFMDKNWRSVFLESLPDFIHAKDEIAYGLTVARMYANINDSHGYMSGNKAIDQMRGAPAPFLVDYIEDKVVVTEFRSDSICKASKINVGDIILKINGTNVEERMNKYSSYFAYSTKASIAQRAAWSSVRGPESQEGVFTFQDKGGKQRDVKITWTAAYNKNFHLNYKLDTIALLNDRVGYADLTRMTREQTDAMFERFKNTKAIIFDMRGYPNGTAWSIAPRLTDKTDLPVALIRRPEVLSPNIAKGEMLSNKSYTEFKQTIPKSDNWKYEGKTVMLIDHNAISQSEHSGLFFESVNGTTFIGSPTVGANGDVTNFEIPGGIYLNFSGQGIWHADGRQLQRVGLQPHVPVKPTIKGIRAGKDEVLDKALEWVNKNVK